MTAIGRGAALALFALLAGCAGTDGVISPEAEALIARGDRAAAEAAALRAEVAALSAADGQVETGATDFLAAPPPGMRSRGIAPLAPAPATEADETAARIAALEADAARLEAEAEANWREAGETDADAMDGILRRLKGSRPLS